MKKIFYYIYLFFWALGKAILGVLYAVWYSIKILFTEHDKIEHFFISFGIALYFVAIGLVDSYLWAFFLGGIKEILDWLFFLIFKKRVWIFGRADFFDVTSNFYGVFSALVLIEIGKIIINR